MESVAIVWSFEIESGSFGDNAVRIDVFMAIVVMLFNVVEIDGICNAGLLVQVSQVV